MSHIQLRRAAKELQIKDLDLLAKAAPRCGMELVRGQTSFKSWQSGTKCDHALKVTGGNAHTYEIGVTKNGDFFEMAWDPMSHDINSRCGDNLGKLAMYYQIEQTKRKAIADGNFCEEQALNDGTVKLTITTAA